MWGSPGKVIWLRTDAGTKSEDLGSALWGPGANIQDPGSRVYALGARFPDPGSWIHDLDPRPRILDPDVVSCIRDPCWSRIMDAGSWTQDSGNGYLVLFMMHS